MNVSVFTCELEAAFHYDLLLWMEGIMLEGCIGAEGFCQALQYRVGAMVSHHVLLQILEKLSNIQTGLQFEELNMWLSTEK